MRRGISSYSNDSGHKSLQDVIWSNPAGFLEVCLMIDVSFREYQKKNPCLGKYCGPLYKKTFEYTEGLGRWPQN